MSLRRLKLVGGFWLMPTDVSLTAGPVCRLVKTSTHWLRPAQRGWTRNGSVRLNWSMNLTIGQYRYR